ncbi:MAG: aminotransferase class V-fold PLP-dependent enzyme [Planctomycetota bacterium]
MSTASGPADARHTSDPECPRDLDSIWSWWRDQMPVAKQWAYFDHAAVAPLTAPAAGVLSEFATTAAHHGDVHWMQWSHQCERLRDQTAEMIHCDRQEVTLVPNTTAGVNMVAEGFPWQPGENVVVPEGEFPSNHFPWLNQQHRGVEVRLVPRRGHQVVVDDLIDAIDDSTRIIAVSWVGYASGFRVDVQRLVEMAHQRGVLVFLDAIQGLGIYPLDLRTCDVDFLSADGHKWLLGPEGAGVAVLRKRHLDTLRCPTVGWGSVKQAHAFSGARFDLADDASRFEGGSANMAGLMAFSASMELFLAVRRVHGAKAIADRVLNRASQLRQRLRDAGAVMCFEPPTDPMHDSGIVTFDVPGMTPAEFRAKAIEAGVVVSCRGGGVRASVHVYNDESDLKRLADLV